MKLPILKLLRKSAVVKVVILLAIILVAFGIIRLRGKQLYQCYAAEYDLHRNTNFRWITGRCTATGRDGGQVYVDQLRAFGSDAHDANDVDIDHGN